MDFEIKLLELTRDHQRFIIEEVKNQLPKQKLAELRDGGFLNFDGTFLEQTSTQRVMFAEHLIREGRDPRVVSGMLLWQEFEEFIEAALTKNYYHAVKHFIFKSRLGRREIDILAWNDGWIIVVDCKHWARNLTRSRMRHVTEAQAQRTRALASKPELLQRQGITRLNLPLVPVILSLIEPRDQLIDGVPIVAVSKFASFLHEASPYDPALKTFSIRGDPAQRSLSNADAKPNA